MLIGLVVCGVVEDYAINLIKSIENMSETNDVRCVVIPIKFLGMDYEKDIDNKYAYCYNSLACKGLLSCFDGLIVETASVLMYADEESRQKYLSLYDDMPHVFIAMERENASSVSIDNVAGLTEAMEYMFQNGARKYAMFGGTPNNIDSIVRKQCFEHFLESHNLQYSEKSYQDGNFFLPCEEEADQLVRDNIDADVFVCANDFLARHIYKSLRKYGIRPGKDVSVLGFDDSQICTATYPSISSIRSDIVEVGRVSFELLMDAMQNKPAQKIVVPSKFMLRDSIVHRVPEKEVSANNYRFEDFLMPNIVFENHRGLKAVRDIVLELSDLANTKVEIPFEERLSMIYLKIDELFASDDLDLIDWERFSDVANERYRELFKILDDSQEQQKLSELFIRFHEIVMIVNHYVSPEKNYIDFMQNVGMERFFRETMQYVRNAEANYTRFIKSVDFLGIENAYLYIFDNPMYYIQGEHFEYPEFVNLKASLRNGNVVSVPLSEQKIKRDQIFNNDYVNWNGYNRLMVFPVYSDNIIYGTLICDMKRKGFEQADLFMHQLGSGIRMMNLRIENSQIVDSYEESVRKLKEYNITLDTMSKTDSLTGLNNRRGFFIRAEQMLRLFPNDSLSMIIGYVDMNDLKVVNDRFGHDEGDFALKAIGDDLTDFVTVHNGFAARIGGDEFAYIIVVPKGDTEDAYRKELYNSFDEFNANCIKPYIIDVAVGECLLEKGSELSIEEALRQADEHLYYEKSVRKKKSVLKER